MKIEPIDGASGLERIRDAWSALSASVAGASPALTPEWFEAFWEAFGGGSRAHLLAVRDGERVVGVAPFLLSTRREWGLGWRVASLASNAHSPIAAILLAEGAQEGLDAMLAHFAEGAVDWDLLVLDHQRRGPELDRLLDRLRAARLPCLVESKRVAPVLEIAGSWEEYLAARGKSFRESVRRKVKKAEKAGATVSLHTGAIDPGPLMERVFDVASRSWSGRHGTAVSSGADVRRFYSLLAEKAARQGWLCVALLEHEGRDVAFEFNLDHHGTRHNLKMAFDEQSSALSPGTVLRYHVLRDAFERGFHGFQFLGDREAHKDHWASRWDEYCRVTVYGRRLRARTRHVVRGPIWERARSIGWLRRLKRRVRA